MKTKRGKKDNKGVKYDTGKAKLHILPIEGLIYEAKALTYGMNKYGKNNYKLGMEHTRVLDACLRHIYSYLNGEQNDQESKLPHLAHAKANLAMIIYMLENKVGKDDR